MLITSPASFFYPRHTHEHAYKNTWLLCHRLQLSKYDVTFHISETLDMTFPVPVMPFPTAVMPFPILYWLREFRFRFKT